MAHKKGTPRAPGAGRKKGTPNKLQATVKDMILDALQMAGGANYLHMQSFLNPQAFMSLAGRVVPTQVGIDPDANKITVQVVNFSEDAESKT